MNEPTAFSSSNMLGSNGDVFELEKGDKLRVEFESNSLDKVNVVFMVTPYPKQEKKHNGEDKMQGQDIDSEEEIVTYAAKQSGYHSIYCLFYLSLSGTWVNTYAKKNGNMITEQYVYNYGVFASFGGPSLSSYIYLEEGDTFSVHCDTTQAIDYVTLSVEFVNDSELENNGNANENYLLQKTGE